MGYTVDTGVDRTITWNNNPNGNLTYAKLSGDDIVEFVVQNAQAVSIVYSLNQTDLAHLQEVIGELLAEIAAP